MTTFLSTPKVSDQSSASLSIMSFGLFCSKKLGPKSTNPTETSPLETLMRSWIDSQSPLSFTTAFQVNTKIKFFRPKAKIRFNFRRNYGALFFKAIHKTFPCVVVLAKKFFQMVSNLRIHMHFWKLFNSNPKKKRLD